MENIPHSGRVKRSSGDARDDAERHRDSLVELDSERGCKTPVDGSEEVVHLVRARRAEDSEQPETELFAVNLVLVAVEEDSETSKPNNHLKLMCQLRSPIDAEHSSIVRRHGQRRCSRSPLIGTGPTGSGWPRAQCWCECMGVWARFEEAGKMKTSRSLRCFWRA